MVASRNVISNRAFNKIAHEWAQLTLNLQSSQVLNFYWSFQVYDQNWLGGKSSCCRFSFSAVRNPITKATDYVTLDFYFHILVVFPPLAMRIFRCFSSHDSRPKISTNDLRLRMTKVFPEWQEKASDASAADWRYQTHVKLSYFSRVLIRLFSGLKILV